MPVLNELSIARDCYWAISSGDAYLTDENGNLSSEANGLYTSLNDNNSEYIYIHGSGLGNYYSRLTSSNVDVTAVDVSLEAECTPPGSAILYINSKQIGSFDIDSKAEQSNNFILNNSQIEYIHNGRISSNYDYFRVQLGNSDNDIDAKLYNLTISYSGEATWNNHQDSLPNVFSPVYYPSTISARKNAIWDGSVSDIQQSVDDASADSTYITNNNLGDTNTSWKRGIRTYNGGLSLNFNNLAESGLNPLTKLTRAQLKLRMAFPPSGTGDNVRDTFEVNGYNHLYKNNDNIEELSYTNASQMPLHDSYGYYLYGAGDIVEYDQFKTYTVELNFLDPFEVSGDYKSTEYANSDMISNMEFQLVGIPSGTQISASELQVEYIPNNTMSLYTVGKVHRCAASSTVDVNNSLAGNGGWHHQGWRLNGPNVIEEDVFTNFYTFSETSGTRTYPETTKTYYFPDGDEDETVYADYVLNCPVGTGGDDGDVEPLLKEPTRREYYRNPVGASDLTPSYEDTLRDVSNTKPHYYRHMIFHDVTFDYLDLDLDGVYENELATDDISQIFFEDRLGLTQDFTLYFALYRHYGLQSYGRFFHRGLSVNEGINSYEILGDLENNLVRFTVQAANGSDQKIETEISRNTKEPILIWFNCGYEITYGGMTTMTLNIHDDTRNYFSNDWKHSKHHFTGKRKQYSTNTLVVTDPRREDYIVEWGGPRTTIGTLETLTFEQQLSRKLYLHRTSPVEFGYANEYIHLDYRTSQSTINTGYNTSTDKEKYFLSSRLANSQYLQENPSGIRWVVPYGSGAAEWSTSYDMFNWSSGVNYHSVFNPVSTAGTNNTVAPSAIYVDFSAAHSTDHPSGLTVYVDVEFDAGTTDNWKVAHTELNVPSGGGVWSEYLPIDYNAHTSKHINMDEGPIRFSDLENINITLTTKYPDIEDTEYFGSVEIRSLNVYFDSYCVANTGINELELYTHGSATTLKDADKSSLDLFVKGKTTTPTNPRDGSIDLYIEGYPHLASGDITLYTVAEKAPVPEDPEDVRSTSVNLFVKGLNPPNASGDLSLYAWGTTSPAIREFTTLYTNSNLDPMHRLPLYITAGTGSKNTSMNLFMGNYPDSINNLPSGLPLYTFGPDFNSASTTLYIKSQPGTEGAYWNKSNMNLYIDRDSEATASRLTLYLAQNNVTNNMNMYTTGKSTINNLVDEPLGLYIKGSGGPINNTLKFYTHGF